MGEQGYLQARPNRPATLGIVIAAHAAALTALILARGPQVMPLPPVIKTYFVPDMTEPPPLPPEPAPRETPRSSQPAERRDPAPETSRALDPTPAGPTAFPALPPLPGPVTEPVVPLPPLPPVREPVISEAQPDARAIFQPAYPPALQRAEVEGRATVRVLIGADGRVRAVEIVSADDPAFAEATRRQALKAWRFRPAMRDGVAVESWRTMTVHFRLQA